MYRVRSPSRNSVMPDLDHADDEREQDRGLHLLGVGERPAALSTAIEMALVGTVDELRARRSSTRPTAVITIAV